MNIDKKNFSFLRFFLKSLFIFNLLFFISIVSGFSYAITLILVVLITFIYLFSERKLLNHSVYNMTIQNVWMVKSPSLITSMCKNFDNLNNEFNYKLLLEVKGEDNYSLLVICDFSNKFILLPYSNLNTKNNLIQIDTSKKSNLLVKELMKELSDNLDISKIDENGYFFNKLIDNIYKINISNKLNSINLNNKLRWDQKIIKKIEHNIKKIDKCFLIPFFSSLRFSKGELL